MPVLPEKDLVEGLKELDIRDIELPKLIQRIDRLKLIDGSCENAVYYTSYCKLAAQLSHQENRYSDMLYFLSECHAAAFRQICYRRRVMFADRYQSNFNEEYTSFRSSYADMKYDGLCRRIQELPKEWTLVQITQQFHTGEGWNLRKPNTVVNETGLHIVRYNCGSSETPVHVYIPPLNNDYASESVLELVYSSVLDKSVHASGRRVKYIKERRLNNCSKLKEVTRDIANVWLKEWRCLLLGKICDKKTELLIKENIDTVFATGTADMAECDKLLLAQIINGCGLLVRVDVENALSQLVKDDSLRARLLEKILKIRDQLENVLYYIKRYPVIFLIDEKLQCIPWEETLGLRSHPISRLPSVHFTHAFYKMHENRIVDGNVVIDSKISGYYFINPDQTLHNTEKQLVDFLSRRLPEWKGTVGTTSSKEEVSDAVTKNDIFLYCGHGSGIQYMKSSHLFTLDAKAIPLLFGCGSVEYKDFGGRVPFISYANSYMISGSPCVLGMLYPVTSMDTDNMALALLNYWLPGKPVVIDGMEKFSEDTIHSASTEPELLRAMRFSRSVANFYFNSCAMVVHGLPVIIK